jgi:hypothetical protein
MANHITGISFGRQQLSYIKTYTSYRAYLISGIPVYGWHIYGKQVEDRWDDGRLSRTRVLESVIYLIYIYTYYGVLSTRVAGVY